MQVKGKTLFLTGPNRYIRVDLFLDQEYLYGRILML
jgi:hypothetical protein